LGKEVIDDQLNSKKHKYLKRFKLNAKQIARTGTSCKSGDANGIVTSGNISPVLGHPIGLFYLKQIPLII
jgi:glycine cleavage system aminomethyltransferase T